MRENEVTFNRFMITDFSSGYSYLLLLYSLLFIFVIVGILDFLKIKLKVQILSSFLIMLLLFFINYLINSELSGSEFFNIITFILCFYTGILFRKLFRDYKLFFNYKSIS